MSVAREIGHTISACHELQSWIDAGKLEIPLKPMVDIDHGFGYKTRYAHMHGFNVYRGQRIKRGELIGYVGNTGLSTGPHLHYEVMINGKQVNPVYYFFNDLNPADYEKILKLAAVENMSLGGTK